MKLQIILNILGLISFFICIWLGAPLIHINGSYPFEGILARLIIIFCLIFIFIVLIIFYLILKRYKNKKFTEDLFTHFFSRDPNSPSLIKKKIKKAFNLLKKAARKEGKTAFQLKSAPCFLVVGGTDSGRETAIRESGFHFPELNSLNPLQLEGTDGVKGCQWWFAEEGILFTIPLEEKNREDWIIALKLLKKHRQAKPIQAVIVTCHLMDFVSRTEEEKESYFVQLKESLYNIYNHLQISFPIYFLFTKCDQLSGFQEFFQDLSFRERDQVWGIQFNTNKETIDYKVNFLTQFQILTLRLTQLLPWKLSHSLNQEVKDRIYLFPNQLQFLVPSFLSLLKNVFSKPAEADEFYLQGLYFSSALQTGKSLDLVVAGNANRVGTESSYWHYQENKKWSYFFKETFSQILSHSKDLVKYNRRKTYFYLCIKRTSYTFLFLVLFVNSIGLYLNYYFNKEHLNQIFYYLNDFKEKEILAEKTRNFDNILGVLLPLENAINLYEKSRGRRALAFQLYTPYQIDKDLDGLLENFLQYTFLPYIKDHIATRIELTSSDNENVEKLLEIYLQFAHPEKINKNLIQKIMDQEWEKQYPKTPKKREKLNYYLKLALEHPRALSLNENLIKQTQRRIQREDPVYRIYEILQDYGDNFSSLPFIPYPELSEAAFEVFHTLDPEYSIPMLFTLEGFKEIVVKQIPLLIKDIEEEDKSLGINIKAEDPAYTTYLTQRIYEFYGHDYGDHWMKFLNSLEIKQGGSLSEQIKIIEILTKKDSPLIKLVNLLGSQSQDPSLPESVKNSFDFINIDLASQLPTVIGHLTNLFTYSKQILYSPDSKKACFDAAKSRLSSILKPDPFFDLRTLAETLPDPFKGWFITLEENTWKLILENANSYIEENWQIHFLQEFNKTLGNKYPFNINCMEDVSLADFTSFFGPKGKLDQFFEIYIQAFLKNPDPSHLQWKELEGQSLKLDKDILSHLFLGFSIKELFFKGNSPTPHLELTISPQLLSENATAVHLKLGNQLITYRHEAPQSYPIQWPFKLEDQECKFNFQDFNGKQQSLSFKGEWSLFRWLNKGVSLPSPHSYEWKLGDFMADFEVVSSTREMIDFKILQEFAEKEKSNNLF